MLSKSANREARYYGEHLQRIPAEMPEYKSGRYHLVVMSVEKPYSKMILPSIL